jgi:hypothetical protein
VLANPLSYRDSVWPFSNRRGLWAATARKRYDHFAIAAALPWTHS